MTTNNAIPFINKEKLLTLNRCSSCLLPDTFPFLGLDENGECVYCRTHKKRSFLGRKALEYEVAKRLGTLKKEREYDCIVPFSGGRDSSWMLHFARKELGLRTLAYTYDWGMTTDIGYRNMKQMTQELGVRHLVIDGGIARKRSNIRKNVGAWLKKPDIATVTLFMAGDKQVYFHIPRIARELGTDIVFWGENYLERTDFKTAFLGINETFDKRNIMDLSLLNRLRMAFLFAGKMISNPSFFNSGLVDAFTGYFGFFFYPKNYISPFKYFPWNEREIHDTLFNRYGWEKEEGYPSTWRIGDGTSALYNYIYCRIAGFSENDTFRSNQIREGYISRSEGLSLVVEENMPREDSIRWYFQTIGVDPDRAISAINAMGSMY